MDGPKGLRADSVGLLGTVTLGLAAVAPAYSIAITLGFVVLTVGDLAPAALLLGFVPILLTAFAFRELNRAMPDCGTTFVWGTRAFGPFVGWLAGGWVVQICTVIAMTALAAVGATSLVDLTGLDAENTVLVTLASVLLLAVVTAVGYRGIEMATWVQYALLGLQLVALLAFGIAAFAQGGAGTGSLNPLGFDGFGPFTESVLLCLFIYWGWDSLITVNEETVDAERTPGRAAIISTLLLLGTYLFIAFSAINFAGVGGTGLGLGNEANAGDFLAVLAPEALGGFFGGVVKLAVAVSAISALLTCVVSSPRSTLSMSVHGAAPAAFSKIHPRFATPTFGTLFFGGAAATLLVVFTAVSSNFLGDAILSIGLLIAFYYGVTGLACVWYFRTALRESTRDLVFKGVLPLLGSLMMLGAFLRSAKDIYSPGYGATSIGGVGGVFLLGVGSIVLGLIVMLTVRAHYRSFFHPSMREEEVTA